MRNINEVMKELAEMNALLEETSAIVEGLKDEVKAYMTETGTDEVLSDSGKATWREVISNRFASTEFKKVHANLYKAFTKQTTIIVASRIAQKCLMISARTSSILQ